MTTKQKLIITGLIDLFLMICIIATLSLNGTWFYVLETIFVILWLCTSALIDKGCKELNKQKKLENNSNESKNDVDSKGIKLAKYIIFTSIVFSIILTIIIILANK